VPPSLILDVIPVTFEDAPIELEWFDNKNDDELLSTRCARSRTTAMAGDLTGRESQTLDQFLDDPIKAFRRGLQEFPMPAWSSIPRRKT
jgi:hypothetical protein